MPLQRHAAHYVCFDETQLPEYAKSILRRDRPRLVPVSASFLASHPEYTEGFTHCVLEVSETGQLLRLFPFTQEIESTEWHPGIVNLAAFIAD